jgi:DNA-binding NtrC family response regulator
MAINSEEKVYFRIMVVDDEESIRQFLVEMLKAAGYTDVVAVESGEAALLQLASDSFDLAVIDKNMPGVGGLEVLKRCRRDQPNCQVVLITAYGSLESAMQAIDLGAFAYITKPFEDLKAVMTRVDAALGQAALVKYNADLINRIQLVVHKLKRIQSGGESSATAEGARDAVGQLMAIVSELQNIKKAGVQSLL